MLIDQFNSVQKLYEFLKNKHNFGEYNFPEIASQASNLVFFRGNHESPLMIIGEAPGKDEDLLGQPFVGRCGKLLQFALKNIEKTETDVYITNSVFWRPTLVDSITNRVSNRAPSEQEITWCRPYLFKHIELIKPKIILTLGLVAFYALQNLSLDDKRHLKINSLRKKIVNYSQDSKIKVVSSFHPAYILRQKNLYPEFKQDLQYAFEQI